MKNIMKRLVSLIVIISCATQTVFISGTSAFAEENIEVSIDFKTLGITPEEYKGYFIEPSEKQVREYEEYYTSFDGQEIENIDPITSLILSSVASTAISSLVQPATDWLSKTVWSAIFGKEPADPAIQHLEKLEQMMNKINIELQSIKAQISQQALKDSIEKKLTLTAVADLTTRNRMQEFQLASDTKKQYQILDEWYNTKIDGTANMLDFIEYYADTVTNSNGKSIDGDYFRAYDKYASYAYPWEFDGYPFRDSQRERDLYLLTKMVAMAKLYMAKELKLHPENKATIELRDKRVKAAVDRVLELSKNATFVKETDTRTYNNLATGERLVFKVNVYSDDLNDSFDGISRAMSAPAKAGDKLESKYLVAVNDKLKVSAMTDQNNFRLMTRDEMLLVAQLAANEKISIKNYFMKRDIRLYGSKSTLADVKFKYAYYTDNKAGKIIETGKELVGTAVTRNHTIIDKLFYTLKAVNLNCTNLETTDYNQMTERKFWTYARCTQSLFYPAYRLREVRPDCYNLDVNSYVPKDSKGNPLNPFPLRIYTGTVEDADNLFKYARDNTEKNSLFIKIYVSKNSKVNPRNDDVSDIPEEAAEELVEEYVDISDFFAHHPVDDRLYIDGKLQEGENNPQFMYNERNYVDAAIVTEYLGGTAEIGDGSIICKLDGVELEFSDGSTRYLVDGESKDMDVEAAFLDDTKAYVPVYYLCEEGFGLNVEFDPATHEIFVMTGKSDASGTVKQSPTDDKLYIDSVLQEGEYGPQFIYNERNYVNPVIVTEHLGGSAEIVDGTVICRLDGVVLEFRNGSSQYLVDGQTRDMDAETVVIDDRTAYVPVYYLCEEGFGLKVEYDPDTHEIFVNTNKPQDDPIDPYFPALPTDPIDDPELDPEHIDDPVLPPSSPEGTEDPGIPEN